MGRGSVLAAGDRLDAPPGKGSLSWADSLNAHGTETTRCSRPAKCLAWQTRASGHRIVLADFAFAPWGAAAPASRGARKAGARSQGPASGAAGFATVPRRNLAPYSIRSQRAFLAIPAEPPDRGGPRFPGRAAGMRLRGRLCRSASTTCRISREHSGVSSVNRPPVIASA